MNDQELLQAYVQHDSQAAFATLVDRHINLVYSAALRCNGKPHQAEEITQAVFILLARKAGQLSPNVVLPGWLFSTARLTASNFLRTEIRRLHREQEAYMRSNINEPETDSWNQIAPLLDEGIASLREVDRNAIVLRFLEGKDLADVSLSLGTSKDGARMRVDRAVEKLRCFFAKRGVMLSGAAIAGAVTAKSVQAAPASLAAEVTASALAKGAAVTVTTAALVKATAQAMVWAKLKIAAVTGASVLLVGGTAVVAANQIASRSNHDKTQNQEIQSPTSPASNDSTRDELSLRTNSKTSSTQVSPSGDPSPVSADQVVWSLDSQILAQQPPVALLRPSQATTKGQVMLSGIDGPRMIQLRSPVKNLFMYAYHLKPDTSRRIIMPADAPQGLYDCMVTLPEGGREALQKLLRDQLGLVGKLEMRPESVSLLVVKNPHAPGLQPSPETNELITNSKIKMEPDGLSASGVTMTELTPQFAALLKSNLIDQTALSGRFDMRLFFKSEASASELRQAILEQLGLELIPGPAQPVEVLVVERN